MRMPQVRVADPMIYSGAGFQPASQTTVLAVERGVRMFTEYGISLLDCPWIVAEFICTVEHMRQKDDIFSRIAWMFGPAKMFLPTVPDPEVVLTDKLPCSAVIGRTNEIRKALLSCGITHETAEGFKKYNHAFVELHIWVRTNSGQKDGTYLHKVVGHEIKEIEEMHNTNAPVIIPFDDCLGRYSLAYKL